MIDEDIVVHRTHELKNDQATVVTYANHNETYVRLMGRIDELQIALGDAINTCADTEAVAGPAANLLEKYSVLLGGKNDR